MHRNNINMIFAQYLLIIRTQIFINDNLFLLFEEVFRYLCSVF